MKINRMAVVAIGILVVALGVLAGCTQAPAPASPSQQSGGGSSTQTVKIGIAIPLSGSLSAIGENLKMAHQLAIDEINGAGGVKALGGAKLEIVYGDTQGDPKIATTETERLIAKEGVVAMMDAFQSSATYPSAEVAERYEIPYVVPTSTMDDITKRGFKYTFRFIHPAGLWGQEQIRFLSDMKKESGKDLKRLALVYENTDQGQSTAKGWRQYAPEFGFEVVLNEAYARDTADFTPLATKIKNAKPDAILLTSYISDAIQLQKTFKEQSVEALAYIGSSSGHADPSFVKETGKASEYLFDLTEWGFDLAHTPIVKETNERFKKASFNKDGRNMNGVAAYRYAGLHLLADAMERAKSKDPKAIRKALTETNLSSGPITILPFSPLTFGDDGQAKGTKVIMVQFQDGVRTTVWPKDVAAKKPLFPMPAWAERK